VAAALPILQHQLGLRQACHLPGLATPAIQVDVRVTERDETQCKVAALVALRIPTHDHHGQLLVSMGQFLHFASKPALVPVGDAAANAGSPQSDRSRDRRAPGDARVQIIGTPRQGEFRVPLEREEEDINWYTSHDTRLFATGVNPADDIFAVRATDLSTAVERFYLMANGGVVPPGVQYKAEAMFRKGAGLLRLG
jgi:hypothetical protein